MSFDTESAGVNFNLHQLDEQTRNDLYDDAYRLKVARGGVDAYEATAAFRMRSADAHTEQTIRPELGVSPESVSAEILLHLVAYDTAESRAGAAAFLCSFPFGRSFCAR
ncbi:MAG: hypothetical protein VB092_04895 [Oscillospiraceae bacterium]|nr:hypothetical protein [Oscillospiraceae bacterium]